MEEIRDEVYRKVAIFFFYAFLDEALATKATLKAVGKFQSVKSDQETDSLIVYYTRLIWDQYRNKFVKGRLRLTANKGWLPPDGSELSSWKEFQKQAEDDEILAVIWSHILEIDDANVSRGLGVTKGTVRFRAARGLRRLGVIRAGEASASGI